MLKLWQNACNWNKRYLPLQVFATEHMHAHTSDHTWYACITHTDTRTHLALTPVQEHMSPPNPLRISVINQALRCRLRSTNTHTHVSTAPEAEHSKLSPGKILLFRSAIHCVCLQITLHFLLLFCTHSLDSSWRPNDSSLPFILSSLLLCWPDPAFIHQTILLRDVTRARHFSDTSKLFFFFSNQTLNEYVARQFSLN